MITALIVLWSLTLHRIILCCIATAGTARRAGQLGVLRFTRVIVRG